MNIFLIGFMGSGKTTLAKQLAKKLHFTYIDTDEWIENLENQKIYKIFSQKGEQHFREKEAALLLHFKLIDNCVIAVGGGMPCFGDNIKIMNELGTTIWLNVDENTLFERLEKQKQQRPLLTNVENLKMKINTLLKERIYFYAQANYTIKNPTLEKVYAKINLKME